jgi:hypothetical protein
MVPTPARARASGGYGLAMTTIRPPAPEVALAARAESFKDLKWIG